MVRSEREEKGSRGGAERTKEKQRQEKKEVKGEQLDVLFAYWLNVNVLHALCSVEEEV